MLLGEAEINILKRLQEINNQPNNINGIQHSDLANELDINPQTLILKYLKPLKNNGYIKYPLDSFVKIDQKGTDYLGNMRKEVIFPFQQNRVDRFLHYIKNHRFLSIIVVFGIVVIAIASFTDAVGKILQFGTSIISKRSIQNEQNEEVLSPMEFDMMRAAVMGDTAKVRVLLNQGVNVNAKDHNGRTALMHAATNGFDGNIETLRAILEAGADVNARNKDGETALIMATQKGHTDIVRALLEVETEVNIKDSYGITALGWAEENDYSEIIALIKQAGAIVAKNKQKSYPAKKVEKNIPLDSASGEIIKTYPWEYNVSKPFWQFPNKIDDNLCNEVIIIFEVEELDYELEFEAAMVGGNHNINSTVWIDVYLNKKKTLKMPFSTKSAESKSIIFPMDMVNIGRNEILLRMPRENMEKWLFFDYIQLTDILHRQEVFHIGIHDQNDSEFCKVEWNKENIYVCRQAKN